MSIYLSLLVSLLGLIVFALASNPKASECGKLAYFAGLFVFLLQFSKIFHLP